MSSLFHAESLLRSARDLVHGDDFGDPFFREGLEVLLRSWEEEASLHPARAWRSCGAVVDWLVGRAQITARLKQRPEIAQRPIASPLFITGLPRTGTTMLHNVLARIPGFKAFTPWEMRNPVTPEDAGPDWTVKQIARTAEDLRALYMRVPGFDRIHKIEAEAPDECNWLLRNSFTTLAYGFMYRVPGYMRWVTGAPRHAAYADYRRQLQVLRDRSPDGQLVLKDPMHLWHLDALLDTFPDAVVIQLHRDPAEAVSSLCSLCHALHTMDSGHSDPAATGAYCVEMVDRGLPAMLKLRAERTQARFIDVEYRNLIRDPLGEIERICESVGRPIEERGALAVSHWLEKNPHRPGGHRYRPEDFGLKAGALRERYAEYIRRFNVQVGS